jgi:hypothetical protein
VLTAADQLADGVRTVTTIGGTVYEEFGGDAQTVTATVANSLAAWFDLDSRADVNTVDIWVSGVRLERLTMTGLVRPQRHALHRLRRPDHHHGAEDEIAGRPYVSAHSRG